MADSAIPLAQGENLLPLQPPQGAAGGGVAGFARRGGEPPAPFSGVLEGRMHALQGEAAQTPQATTRLAVADGSPSPAAGKALPLPAGDTSASPLAETSVVASAAPLISLLSELTHTQAPLEGQDLIGESDPARLYPGEANGLLPLTMLDPESAITTGTQAPSPIELPRQTTSGLTPQALLQARAETIATPLSGTHPASVALNSDTANETAVPAVPLIPRPLSDHQRLMLERVRSAAAVSSPGVADVGDKALSQDTLTWMGLDMRRAMLGNTNGVSVATSNDYKPIIEQLVQPLHNNSVTVEENSFSPLLAGMQRSSGTVAAQALPVLNVATPVGQQGWSNEMSQRVSWMAGSEVREAQLQLHPRHLGPLEVRISFGQEHQLNVNFTVSNAMAREAVDAALPRLREMLEQQGMNLADANVSQESFAERQRQGKSALSGQGRQDNDSEFAALDDLGETLLPPLHSLGEGLLDAYA